MARPKEEGLKYFPFDIDFFNDEKIEAISGEFGIKGEIATIKLLCAVYRNGYFIEWNEMLKMKLLKNLPGVSLDLLEQIINRLVKWEFFDKNLFDSVKILTSHGVQKRYFEAIRRRRKSKDYPYILIDSVCGCESKDALSSVDYNNSDSDEIVKCKVNVCNNPTSTDINVVDNPTKESKGKNNNSLPYTQAQEEFPPPDIFDKPLKECYNELASNMSWIEPFVMNIRSAGHNEFTIETFYECLKRFFAKLQNEGETQKAPKDAMSHFSRWLDIDLKKQEDDKRRAKSFSPAATNPTGKVVCSEVKAATDSKSTGAAQKDYSARF